MSPWAINRLSKAVVKAAVIAYPTDTIWGLGCHPMSAAAAIRIINIKQRSLEKGLILLSPDLEYCKPYLGEDLSVQQLNQLAASSPHPVTWLVPAHPDCPVWLRGQHTTIAIRLTNHPFVASICSTMHAPIVSTSANRHSKPSVRNSLQARCQFADELDHIVTGFSTGTGLASEIKSLETGHVFRKSYR
jgi:L-threonylcarbamoyladenylate synthase